MAPGRKLSFGTQFSPEGEALLLPSGVVLLERNSVLALKFGIEDQKTKKSLRRKILAPARRSLDLTCSFVLGGKFTHFWGAQLRNSFPWHRASLGRHISRLGGTSSSLGGQSQNAPVVPGLHNRLSSYSRHSKHSRLSSHGRRSRLSRYNKQVQ